MAVYYLDSSDLVKRYVHEAGTAWILAVTDPTMGHDIYVGRITGPEIIAAFFKKVRTGEVAAEDTSRASENFRTDFRNHYQIVEATVGLVDDAMTLAERYTLGGYNAVQLAAASELHALRGDMHIEPLTFVSADHALNRVAELERIVSDDPNNHD